MSHTHTEISAETLENARLVVSNDEGQTWLHRKSIYDDPREWYCDAAIAFVGDRILLGHCAGIRGKGMSGSETTFVTSFDLSWLYRQWQSNRPL